MHNDNLSYVQYLNVTSVETYQNNQSLLPEIIYMHIYLRSILIQIIQHNPYITKNNGFITEYLKHVLLNYLISTTHMHNKTYKTGTNPINFIYICINTICIYPVPTVLSQHNTSDGIKKVVRQKIYQTNYNTKIDKIDTITEHELVT